MNIKVYFLALIICFSHSYVLGQQLYEIKGTVIDSVTQFPAEYVTINLKTANGNPVMSTLTKEGGSFLLENIKAGKYLITVIAVSYKSKVVSVSLIDSLKAIIDLGKINILGRNNRLNEIVITAERPIITQQTDRITYDLKADPDSKRENVLEVLRKVPLLSLDDEDNIRLKGSTDFKIFVNGKPSGVMAKDPAMALRAMRAKNVRKIEVITTPSAKYDSEGAAGIINIVTNTELEGYNVILEAFDNTLIASGVGTAFTFKKNKLGITGYLGRWFRDYPNTATSSYRAINKSPLSRIEQGANSQPSGTSTPFNADLSFEIDSLNLLTGSAVLSPEHRDFLGNQLLKSYNETGSLDYSYSVDNKTRTKDNGLDLGLNYQLGFRKYKDMFLTASYRYFKTSAVYDNTNNTTGKFNYMDNSLIQNNGSGLTEQTIQLDYTKPAKKLSLEGGVKVVKRNNYSDFNTNNINQINGSVFTTDQFSYDQDIYSVYNSYQFQQNSWTVKAGLRLERTDVQADFITSQAHLNHNYNNLVPSISFQQKLKNSSSLNLGYTQRILRPGILQLNPFENRSNSLIYTSGNPALVPVTSHNFELGYNQSGKGNLNINTSYIRSDNTIQEVSTLGADKITHFTYANTGSYSALGANVNINFPFSKRLRMNINGLVQHIQVLGTINGSLQRNDGLQYNTSSDFSYNLKGDWKLGLAVMNYGPVITLQGKTNSYVNSSLRLNKEFFNNKLGMIVHIYSPFPAYRIRTVTLITDEFLQNTETRKFARGLYVNLYYTIGSLKEKITKNKRGVKNDDQEKKKGDPNDL